MHGQTRSLHLRNTLAEHLVDKWHPKKIITHSRTLACRARYAAGFTARLAAELDARRVYEAGSRTRRARSLPVREDLKMADKL